MSQNATASSNTAETAGSSTTSGPITPEFSTQAIPTSSRTPQQIMALACLAYIDNYRRARISKAEANIGLIETITAELLGKPGQRVSTVAGPYIAMLDEVDSEHTRAGNASARVQRPHSEEPEQDDEETPLSENRSRAGTPEPGEPARKRSKLDYSSVETAIKNRVYQPLSANLKRTNEILKNWSKDVSR